MQLPWALTAASRKYAQRLATRMALAGVGAAAALVGLGFATDALYAALRAQYGVVDAAAALAAIYLVLAGVLFACRGLVGSAAARDSLGDRRLPAAVTDATAKQIEADAAQAATLALGVEAAKQLTPAQLVLLAALTGFVAGRKI
jgi:hypothetical protein